MTDFLQEHWGSLSSVFGLVITVISFIIIRRSVLKARDISNQVRKDMLLQNSVVDFSAALSTMEDIKIFHRNNTWEILPTKYASLRSILIAVRELNPGMPTEHKRIIQSAIASLSSTENIIEQTIQTKTAPPDIPRLNKNISSQIDKLRPILIDLSNQIGR